jgi:SAM-dependent methyltransferase
VSGFEPFVRCPRCKGAVRTHLAPAGSDSPAEIQCTQCRRRFPRRERLWLLFDDVERELRQLGFQAREFVRENGATMDKMLAQLAAQHLHPRTRTRLERVRGALDDHRQRLLDLLASIGIEPLDRTEDDRERVPGEGTITAYYHQIHRDWGWDAEGSIENAEALRVLSEALPHARPLGNMLVLGAGASRLPYDLHRLGGATTTIALDINPLPFIVASRVTAGETLRLFEFPMSPRTSETAAVDRELRCEHPGADDFHFVLGDGLAPPVPDGVFDTVLTPWFIDQIPRDLVELLPTIRRVLKPGGRWINHGPLLYHPSHTMYAHRYRSDEVLGLVEDHGFSVVHQDWTRMLYMESPAGSQGRTEGVLTFVAVRGDLVARSVDAPAPTWLDDPDVPIDALPAFHGYVPPHPMFAKVLELVDGRRTANDIAQILVRDHRLPESVALGGVQTCLREIYRATSQYSDGRERDPRP